MPDWFRRRESKRPQSVRSTRSRVLTPERVVGAEIGSCPPPPTTQASIAERDDIEVGVAIEGSHTTGRVASFDSVTYGQVSGSSSSAAP